VYARKQQTEHEAMTDGWIKLHRKTVDNEIYQHDPTAWRVFCHFLLIVDHRTGSRNFGRFQIARELGINPNTLYSALKRLENAKMITQAGNNKFTILSICNWHEYQSLDNNAINNPSTTNQQQINTKQELRTKNKEINTIPAEVGGEVNEAIKLFGSINPSYEVLFKRKNQREAIARLLAKYGLEGLTKLVEAARRANGKEFAPTITTPCQLEDKLGQLKSFYDRKETNQVWKIR